MSNEIDPKVCRRAMLCHLINITIWIPPFPLFLLLTVIFCLLDAHPFVKACGKEVLNFSGSILLYILLLFTISIAICGSGAIGASFAFGIGSILILILTHIIMVVFGGIQVTKGISYHYPFVVRWFHR